MIITYTPYLLDLFNTLAPDIADIDWHLDRAHRSLDPKPSAGDKLRDVVVCFHYYDSTETLTLATHNHSQIDYKGDKLQIFSNLSYITLAKWYSLHPITFHLQTYKISYFWAFLSSWLPQKMALNMFFETYKKGKPFSKTCAFHLSLKMTCFSHPPQHKLLWIHPGGLLHFTLGCSAALPFV